MNGAGRAGTLLLRMIKEATGASLCCPFCELEKSTFDWKIRAYVQDIQTIGHRIKVKRLQKGLLQIDVAKLLGVTEDCITCWENNRSQPMIHFIPTIIEFFGYVPIEIDTSTFGGKLNEYRIKKGVNS